MSAVFAFLHHVAAFALVAALAIEFVLIRSELTVRNARTILLTDAAIGAAAGVILGVGFLRVFFFEKGAAYYFHSVPFIAKLSLFAIIGLLSIYPTRQFFPGARRSGKAQFQLSSLPDCAPFGPSFIGSWLASSCSSCAQRSWRAASAMLGPDRGQNERPVGSTPLADYIAVGVLNIVHLSPRESSAINGGGEVQHAVAQRASRAHPASRPRESEPWHHSQRNFSVLSGLFLAVAEVRY